MFGTHQKSNLLGLIHMTGKVTRKFKSPYQHLENSNNKLLSHGYSVVKRSKSTKPAFVCIFCEG